MDEIFELIGKIVLAVGGAGVIIVAVSSYISKLFADWFLQKEKAKYEREIEKYRVELDKELEKVKRINEKVLFADKKIFEYEYEIIKEVIPLEIQTYDCVIKVLFVLSSEENGIEDKKELVKMAFKMLQRYYDKYIQYAVFVPEDVYLSMQSRFKDLNELIIQLDNLLKGEDNRSEAAEAIGNVQNGQRQFLDEMRRHYRN